MNLLRLTIALSVGVSMLSACMGNQQISPSQVSQVQGSAKISPDGNCGGTHKVRIVPCPVILTNGPIEIAFTGNPKIENTALDACGDEECTIQQVDATHWDIYPYVRCASTETGGIAYGAGSRLIGSATLLVKNRDHAKPPYGCG